MNKERLAKIMAQRGLCSRREAEQYIAQKQVRVDGMIISEQGTKIDTNANIELLPSAKDNQAKKVTIILNKPIGYVSNLPEKGYKPAIDLITAETQYGREKFSFSHKKKLAVVGRLDIDSKGLLLLSQDGVIAKKIISQNTKIEKEYLVRVAGNITPSTIDKLSFGLKLDDKFLKRAKVKQIAPDWLNIILIEGKKRQIRRMCELVGLQVDELKRIRIGSIQLDKLPIGKWRYLSQKELSAFLN